MAVDAYAPCAASGQNCPNDIYAVGLPGVTPPVWSWWLWVNTMKRVGAVVTASKLRLCVLPSAHMPGSTMTRPSPVAARYGFDMPGEHQMPVPMSMAAGADRAVGLRTA